MKLIAKILGAFIALILIVLVASHLIVPGEINKRFNKTHSSPPFDKVSQKVNDFHNQLFIADLHCDALIWGRNLATRSNLGHVDIPRLIEGNLALQVFCVPTKVPRKVSQWGTDPDQLDLIMLSSVSNLWPLSSWFKLDARAIHLSGVLEDVEKNSQGRFSIIRNSFELSQFIARREQDKNLNSGILAIEGLHSLEGDIDNLDEFYKSGYRIMGLVHQFDNDVGGSSYGMKKGGLTTFGRQVIQRMEELGIIIDLAHASENLIDDVLLIATKPVVVSHTGVKGTCNRNRNLSDKHISIIAEKGGLIGIGFWNGAVCGNDARAIARAIKYTVKLVGAEHVALGSDFDGSTATPFDATGMVQVTKALIDEGLSESDIKLIMGENLIELLLKNLPKE